MRNFFSISLIYLTFLFSLPCGAIPSFRVIKTWGLPPGTAQPEIVSDGKMNIFIVVIKPSGKRGTPEYIKHFAYHFDRYWNLRSKPFPVSHTSVEYGEPGDLRAVYAKNELWVVYQSIIMKAPKYRRENISKMEFNAKEQTLVLSRFSQNGRLKSRTAIIAHQKDFMKDNFADPCIFWTGETLFVATGDLQRNIKIREVLPNAKITTVHQFPSSTQTVPNLIGNSFDMDSGILFMNSFSNGPQKSSITRTELSRDFQPRNMILWKEKKLFQKFPTDAIHWKGYTFISYISRPVTSSGSYEIWLKLLNQNGEFVKNFKIEREGYGSVHPTMTLIDNYLFVAWTQKVFWAGKIFPRVLVRKYKILDIERK